MRGGLLVAMVALAAVVAIAGCGGDDDTVAQTTTTTETETTTTETTTTTAEPTTRTIRIVVRGGQVQGGTRRPVIDKGEKVVLVIDTDAGEYVHLHGYDLERDVVPGTPVRIPFTATIPGRFELELHNPSVVIADLQVNP